MTTTKLTKRESTVLQAVKESEGNSYSINSQIFIDGSTMRSGNSYRYNSWKHLLKLQEYGMIKINYETQRAHSL